MPTEAEIEAGAKAAAEQDRLGAASDGPNIHRQSWRAYVPLVTAALEAAERARVIRTGGDALAPWTDGIRVGLLTIGGIIEMAADQVDFEKTYTFEASDHKGQVYRWSGIKAKPRPETGAAVFELPDQKIR